MSINIEEYIQKQLDDLDIAHIVKYEVKEQVRSDVARELKTLVREGIDRIITDEIELVMQEGMEVSTGFEKPVKHVTFAEFFKLELKKRMNKTYEMKKLINKAVTEKVAALFNDQINNAIKEIIEKLTKELGK